MLLLHKKCLQVRYNIAMDDEELEASYEVIAPSGVSFVVITVSEEEQFNNMVRRYTSDNHFNNVSDLQDLDRIIFLELLCYRYSLWVSVGHDYFNEPISEPDLNKQIKDMSTEVRQLKKALSLDKESRDKDKGQDVASYIHNLGIRAREFGVARNEQAVSAVTLMHELKSLVEFHENCTEEERRENGIKMEDLYEWIKDIAIPKFVQLDSDFREKQTYWVRDL